MVLGAPSLGFNRSAAGACALALIVACGASDDDSADGSHGSGGKQPSSGGASAGGRSGAGPATGGGGASAGRGGSAGGSTTGGAGAAGGRGGSAGGGARGGTSGGGGRSTGGGGGRAGDTSGGDTSGGGADAGAGGEPGGAGGMAGSGTEPATCSAGGAADHVNDGLPCAASDACDLDSLGRRFSPPIRIDDGTGCVTRAVYARQPSADFGLIAWADTSPGRVTTRRAGVDAAWATSEFAGPTWGDDLALAVNASDALLVGSRPGRLLANVLHGGPAWSGLTSLATGLDQQSETNADVAFDNTGLGLAVWQSSPTEMSYSTWTAANGWSAAAVYGTETMRASLAPIPMTGGGFVAARINTGGVAVNAYTNGSWHTGYYVDGFGKVGDAEKARAAIGADAAGNVHVAWTLPHASDPYADIVYEKRDVNGLTSGKRGFTDQGYVDPSVKPLFAVNPSGSAILGWHRSSDLDPPFAVIVKEGNDWEGDVRELFGDGTETTVPGVAIDDTGNALVVFAQNDPKWGLVHANRYFVGGTGWESSTYFILYDDQEGGYASSIAAALSPTGEGLIGYVIRKDGEHDRVFAHTLR